MPSNDFDIKTLVTATKAAKRFVIAEGWKGLIIDAWDPMAAANADEEIAPLAGNYSPTYIASRRIISLSDPLKLLI